MMFIAVAVEDIIATSDVSFNRRQTAGRVHVGQSRTFNNRPQKLAVLLEASRTLGAQMPSHKRPADDCRVQ